MTDTAWSSRNDHFRQDDVLPGYSHGTGTSEAVPDAELKGSSNQADAEGKTKQQGRHEAEELKSGHVEERFRVDRRKLEQLLKAVGNDSVETGEGFFSNVMRESGAHVSWPSKLKIGAKSKKDPHVKVRGLPREVAHAKRLIMARLDTKSNRVTLKMDVAHTEHSHVIGKAGANIQRVMADTGCHIHFPDCNSSSGGRGHSLSEKSDQVSITGQPHGVELARQHVRDLLPLTLAFDWPMATAPDSNSPELRDLAQKYGIHIFFKLRTRLQVVTCFVRGSQRHERNVQQCCVELAKLLTGSGNVTVSISMDVAPQHHQAMMGRGGSNVRQIMQTTGATVEFPSTNPSVQRPRSIVLITGGVEPVCTARRLLLGWLPMVLMFDMPSDEQKAMVDVSQVMESTDVFITIKSKPKQASKSVIVKSVERNVANIYQARLLLLNKEVLCDDRVADFAKGSLVSASESLPYQNAGEPGSQPMVNGLNNLYHLPFQPPFIQPPLPSAFDHVMDDNAIAGNRWESSPRKVSSPGPGEERPIAPPPGISTPPRHPPAFTSADSPLSHAGSVGSNSSTSLNPLQSGQPEHMYQDLALSQGYTHSPSANDGSVELTAISQLTSPMRENALASSLNASLAESTAKSAYSQERLQALLQSGTNCEGVCRNLFGDYEDKKIKAVQAMRQARDLPAGVRIPTDAWSGCGLSKSTPDHVLREKMQQQQRFSPSMASVYESEPVSELHNQPASGQSWSPFAQERHHHQHQHRRTATHPVGVVGDSMLPPWSQSNYRQLDVKLWRSLNDHRNVAHSLADVQDLPELLANLDLSKYTSLFDEQEVDLPTFLTLNEADLKDLGIATFGARRRMMLAIEELQLAQHPHPWQKHVMAQLIQPTTSSGGSMSDFSSDGSGGGSGSGSSLMQALVHAQPSSQQYVSPQRQPTFTLNGQW